MYWTRSGGRWSWTAGVLCACALAACGDDDRCDDGEPGVDGGLGRLIRGNLSCSAAERVGSRREFHYDLASRYDRSLLVSVSCGVDGARSTASELFAPELADRAARGEPEAVAIRCVVASAGGRRELRFTPNLVERTLAVEDNQVGWAAPTTCGGTGDIQ